MAKEEKLAWKNDFHTGIRLAHITRNRLIKMFMPTFHLYLKPETLLLNLEEKEMSISNRARVFVLDIEGWWIHQLSPRWKYIFPD